MCGIGGVVRFGDRGPVDPALVERMATAVAHRGPDDSGSLVDGYVGFAHRRLSIIDLGGGHQPMSDASGSVWVTYNGEIYNFRELRRELEGKGHRFRTDCDTEVLIHGYKEWGLDLLGRLNGIFGFGLWDKPRERLLVARDRMGVKFVYWAEHEGVLYFGSELRAILAARPFAREVDPIALSLFLRYRYTPSPLTIFAGIRKLAAGSYLLLEGSEVTVRQYDRFSPRPFERMPSVREARETLLDLYRQAVTRQLMSDVPLGLLLSGGMDSGLLLALMQENGQSRNTYTVGFGESFEDDELEDAAETARILGAPNTQVRLDHESYEAALPHIVAQLEEPIASPSIVPLYFVCERARADVKVALCGQGPDELFAGYTRHLGVRYGAWWRAVPSVLRQPLGKLAGMLPRQDSLRRAINSLGEPDRARRYQQVFSIMSADVIDGLFRDGILAPGAGDTILECWSDLLGLMEPADELGGFNYLEVRSSLPDELLLYADKLSMAHGLELRVPYLDPDVVEYAERLAASFKVRRGKRKVLHRLTCEEHLPRKIVDRKKRGFAVNVVDDWFRTSLAKELESTLRDPQSRMYTMLDYDSANTLLDEHTRGQRDNHKILFSLVVTEIWMRHYLP